MEAVGDPVIFTVLGFWTTGVVVGYITAVAQSYVDSMSAIKVVQVVGVDGLVNQNRVDSSTFQMTEP
ncbi:6118_t:CDS:2 [Funneliformis geosporum]|uniref:6118_t:CDS:1 n=1 Tax=Funneliformis geosporum TaxID=1117311 RepID=A0A9W4SW85_9GLOM|nr:6118_t:CDS:2 [Funneliformis geosporum]